MTPLFLSPGPVIVKHSRVWAASFYHQKEPFDLFHWPFRQGKSVLQLWNKLFFFQITMFKKF
jgi:hypothetical protein